MWEVIEAKIIVKYRDKSFSIIKGNNFSLEIDDFYVIKMNDKFVALIERKDVMEITVE